MPWCQSVCLSVTFVHCGHTLRWIPDIFACLDRWMSLLRTDNAWTGSSNGMMPGFLVEEGGSMEKVVIAAISLILLSFLSRDRNHVTYLFTWRCIWMFSVISVENALSEDGTTNYHIGLKWRPIVRILPTYKTRNRICVTDVCKVRNGKVRTA